VKYSQGVSGTLYSSSLVNGGTLEAR